MLADEGELARQLKVAGICAANPNKALEYSDEGEVYSVIKIVDSDEPGPGEGSINAWMSRGFDVAVGDQLLMPLDGDLAIHVVLDWIRTGQVPWKFTA